jgi:crotonobetainyl-CoA:carnitine CoA-transferase CaiB-like acyl-CoA transferase
MPEAGPFAGLVVVDLSSNLASAYPSLALADFGAEVIQVEPPGGSRLRDQPAWPFWMRGKQSIALDLADPADAEVARSLVRGADVVVDASNPGVAAAAGVDYDDVKDDSPGLVYVSITAFGRSGPLAYVKPYESIAMAKMGASYGRARSGRVGPTMLVPYGATMAAALLAIQGIGVALHERSVTGHGQRVDTTMLQGMLAQDPWAYFIRLLAMRYPDAFSMAPPRAPGRPVPNSWLGFGLLTGFTADEHWLQFAHATPRQFEAFVRTLGLEWTRSDSELHDAPDSDDEAKRDRFWTMMLEDVRSRTVEEWQEVFDREKDVFAEVFRAGTQLFEHPQIVHDHHVATVELPELGSVREPNVFVRMWKTPGSAERPVPAVGEHNAELRARPVRAVARPAGEAPVGRPPLEDVTIIDLGTFYAGPFGSTMLADQGARVIKIEQLDGDPIRFQMPVPESAGVRVTQGKQSIAVDAFSDEGHAIIVELVRGADMVLHSYRGGVAERMGLDADAMHAVNPDLVYHHGVGYGIDGPYARRSAYAPTIAAGSGFARRCGGGGPEGAPLTLDEIKDASSTTGGSPAGHPDGFASLGVAAAMALGLAARDLGAGGQQTMTSMLSTMCHVLGDIMIEYPGMPPVRMVDDDGRGFHALDRLYETADDGWVMLCVENEQEWSSLARELSAEVDLAGDPRYATSAGRTANDAALVDALTAVFATRAAGDWEKALTAVDVACVELGPPAGGLVMNLFEEGQLADQLGMLVKVRHPIFDEHVRTAELVSFSRSGARLGVGARIGEHTDLVLRDLGYDDARIAELREAGVVGGPGRREP